MGSREAKVEYRFEEEVTQEASERRNLGVAQQLS